MYINVPCNVLIKLDNSVPYNTLIQIQKQKSTLVKNIVYIQNITYMVHVELSISDMINTGLSFKQIKKLQKLW